MPETHKVREALASPLGEMAEGNALMLAGAIIEAATDYSVAFPAFLVGLVVVGHGFLRTVLETSPPQAH